MKMKHYSYSKISTYQGCPRKFKLQYIDKLPEVPSDALEIGSEVHEWIKNYTQHCQDAGLQTDLEFLRSVNARPEVMELLERFADTHMFAPGNYTFEEMWKMDFEGYTWWAVVDLLEDRGETVIITDYKTDRAIRSQADIESDLQLKIYAERASEKVPEAQEFICRIDFVRFGVIREVTYMREDIPKIKREMLSAVERIESDEEFKARPGAMCAWCSWTADCPAIKADGVEVITCPEDAEKLAAQKIAIEARKKQIDALLKEYCTVEGNIEVNGMSVGWQISETDKYPNTESIARIIEANGRDPYPFLRVDAVAIKKLLKQDGMRDELDDYIETSKSTTFKAVKAKGGDEG